MFDNDIDYDAVFAVEAEPENGSGAEDQEAAEPETETETEGAEEQEAAEPAGNGDETNASDDTDAPGGPEENEKPKGRKDAMYAAARRRAEAEADRKVDEMIKSFGWADPYHGNKPITTKAEFDAYREAYSEDQRKLVQQKSGLSEEEFTKMVDELPEVKQAKAAQEQAVQAQIQARIAQELREISALDPDVHEMSDVLSGEDGAKVRDYISRGYNLVDAYKIVHFDELSGRAAEGRREQADMNAAGKAHLRATKSRATGMVSVPRETMEYYKIYFPDMSEADIQRDYNKQLNSGGK